MKPLLLLLSFLPTLALAQTQEPPKIVNEQNGKTTNYRAEGSLASTQKIGCIPLAKVKNTFTPPDLYKGVAECISKGSYEFSAKLFALAGIYARFDAERVTDESARQAGTVLIINTFSNVSEGEKTKFNELLGLIAKDPELRGKLCREVKRIGMPQYYPNYMVLHGIKAFTANPNEATLVKDFDSSGVWKTLQSEYLHCPS